MEATPASAGASCTGRSRIAALALSAFRSLIASTIRRCGPWPAGDLPDEAGTVALSFNVRCSHRVTPVAFAGLGWGHTLSQVPTGEGCREAWQRAA